MVLTKDSQVFETEDVHVIHAFKQNGWTEAEEKPKKKITAKKAEQ